MPPTNPLQSFAQVNRERFVQPELEEPRESAQVPIRRFEMDILPLDWGPCCSCWILQQSCGGEHCRIQVSLTVQADGG